MPTESGSPGDVSHESDPFRGGIVMPDSALALSANGGHYGRVAPGDVPLLPLLSAPFNRASSDAGAAVRGSILQDVFDLAENIQAGLATEPTGWHASRNGPWDHFYALGRMQEPENSVAEYIFFKGPDRDFLVEVPEKDFPSWANTVVQLHLAGLNGKILQEKHTGGTQAIEMMVPDVLIRMWPRDRIDDRDVEMGHFRTPVFRFEIGQWPNGIPFLEITKSGRSRYPERFPDLPFEITGVSPSWESLSPEHQSKQTRLGRHVNNYDLATAPVRLDLPDSVLKDASLPQMQLQQRTYRRPKDLRVSPNGLVSPASPGYWEKNGRYRLTGLGSPWEPWWGESLKAMLTRAQPRERQPAYDLFYWLSRDAVETLQKPVKFGPEFGTKPLLESLAEASRVVRKGAPRRGIDLNDPKTDWVSAYFHDQSRREQIIKVIRQDPTNSFIREVWSNFAASAYSAPRETIELADRIGFLNILPHADQLRALVPRLPTRDQVRIMIRNNSNMARLRDPSLQEGDGWSLIAALHPRKTLNPISITLRLLSPIPLQI